MAFRALCGQQYTKSLILKCQITRELFKHQHKYEIWMKTFLKTRRESRWFKGNEMRWFYRGARRGDIATQGITPTADLHIDMDDRWEHFEMVCRDVQGRVPWHLMGFNQNFKHVAAIHKVLLNVTVVNNCCGILEAAARQTYPTEMWWN